MTALNNNILTMSTITKLERAVIPFISRHLNKTLNSAEIDFVRTNLANLPKNAKSLATIVHSIIKQLVTIQVTSSSTVPEGLDDFHVFHQMDVNEPNEDDYQFGTKAFGQDTYNDELTMEIIEFLKFNKKTLFELSQIMNPAGKEYYSYIMLDTDNKNITTSTDGCYMFNLNDGPPVFTQGTINLHTKLHPIKYMRLARTIFGNLHPTEYLKLTESPNNRFAVTIKGLESQSLIMNNGLQFHFIQYLLPSRVSSNPSLSSFNSNRGWFHFNDPHRNVDQIGITFTDMMLPIDPILVHETEAVINATQVFGFVVASPYGNITDPIVIQVNLLESLGLYWGSVSPTGIPDNAGGGTTSLPFKFGGWSATVPGNPVQAALIAAYNSADQPLVKNHDTWFQPPVALAASDLPAGLYPVTLTFNYKPRMTTVLELISEIPPGEKII